MDSFEGHAKQQTKGHGERFLARRRPRSKGRVMGERMARVVQTVGPMRFLAVAGAAGLLILGYRNVLARETRPAAQAINSPAGNAVNGGKVFSSQKCADCHGSQGEGGKGTIAGPRIGPPRFALAMFVDVVRNAKAPMPSFSSTEISDAALADVYAFLKTTAPPPPGAATAAPAGNADNGKALFAKAGCYECHDYQGQGGAGTGPRLAPNPIAFSAFMTQCRQPVNEMPPYTSKVLSDKELADIYAYLQSIPAPPAASSVRLLP
jgi:mono/diheme cytochrome c family protein